jgi:glycosyltransferase involved in cell wall biosynthesis
MTKAVVMNARVLDGAANGQARVAQALADRLTLEHVSTKASGMRGHLWEQTMLPLGAKGRLLWSPSTSGPVFYRNQVVTVHDVAFLDVPEYFAPNFAKAYGAIVPRLVRNARWTVTISNFSKQRILKYVPEAEGKISVIFNGVADAFSPGGEAAARLVASAGVPWKRYFLYFAGADRRKNARVVTEAWKVIVDQLPPDVGLISYGRRSTELVFGADAAEEVTPRSLSLGGVSEEMLVALLSSAEAMVFPSLYEGFGLPVLEAMACGCPVICSNTTSLPEVAGGAAIEVAPDSVGELAQAMLKLASNPALADRLRAAGLARAREFSWDRAADQYRDLFETLA